MSTPSDFERAALARLEREVSLLRAQAAKRDREFASMHMSRQQWSRVYGQPIVGASRPIGEVVAEAQLAARGRVYGGGQPEPEVHYGSEPAGWR
jgi:hypothetical protein